MKLLGLLFLLSLAGISAHADDTATCNNLGFAPKSVHQTVVMGAQTIPYTVTVGFTPIPKADGTLGACIFSTRYTRDDVTDLTKRPITFLYNGGPGNSSSFIHLTGLGPKRLDLGDDGLDFTKGPALNDNPNTFLDVTDMVFIDPVGTGYTIMAPGVDITTFEGNENDAKLFSDFIFSSITTLGRTASPLFLAGESYGGIRTPIAAYKLVLDHKVQPSGLILLSPALDERNIYGGDLGNNQPYITHLPSMIMTGWYYKMTTPQMQSLDLESAYQAAKKFADTAYADAVFENDSLNASDITAMQTEVQQMTGDAHLLWGVYGTNGFIPEQVLQFQDFEDTLLKDKSLVMSWYDGRVTAPLATVQAAGYNDPLNVLINPSLIPAEAAYFGQTLGIPSTFKYVDSFNPTTWNFPTDEEAYSASTNELQSILLSLPKLKVYIASGLFDDSCSTNTIEYAIDQLAPAAMQKISISHFPSGHMVYQGKNNAAKLAQEVRAFLTSQAAQ